MLSQSTAGAYTFDWGVGASDLPTPGHFSTATTGLQLTTYWPSTGQWYVHTGGGWFAVTLGGQAGDTPALRRK